MKTRQQQKAVPDVVAPGADLVIATLTELQTATGGIVQRLDQLEARQARSEVTEQELSVDGHLLTRPDHASPGANRSSDGRPLQDQVDELYAHLEQEEGDQYLWPGRDNK